MAKQAHSSGILSNLSSLLGGMSVNSSAPAADGGLLNKGTEMLRAVFGTHYSTAMEGVSQQAGVRTSTTSSLLHMAVPVVLGLLGKHAADKNLDVNDFTSYLGSQRGSIMSALGNLPSSLGNLLSGLGLGAAATDIGSADSAITTTTGSTVSGAANRTEDAVRDAARDVQATAARPSRWPWLLLLLAASAALFYFMRGCDKDADTTTATPTETTATDPTSAAMALAGTAATSRYNEASGHYIYDMGLTPLSNSPTGRR